MTETFGFDTDKVKAIIQSNNTIKRTTHTYVKDFLTVQEEFLKIVNDLYDHLNTVEHVADIFIDQEKRSILDEYQPLEQVQLAVCGYNNVGKTSFIHELLGFGDFLPVDEDKTTARIVKFSYAPVETACLIKYTPVNGSMEVTHQKDLSESFTSDMTKKATTKSLRKLIKEHLVRPKDMKNDSDAFAKWAKFFIEIRIPSPILELGLHIYDTPGFHGSDPPVLRDNLLDLVRRVHPTLVFLYDNATVSGDSGKCYEKLKEALRSELLGTDIFFLNTKADAGVIRKKASNADDSEDDDDEKLLEKERLCRYTLLLKVDEMKDDINDENIDKQVPSLKQCQCFDIFSTVSPDDSMEKLMKRRAIDRIINYAAEHDLNPTKRVISIVHKAIDTFFDFVLITNRRSRAEWGKLHDEALEWGKYFFKQYRDVIDRIAAEANQRLPQHFLEKYKDIEEKSIRDCETRGVQWNERLDSVVAVNIRQHSCTPFTDYRRYYRHLTNLNKNYRSHEQEFVDMLVERDVIKPVLQQIISQESEHIQQTVHDKFTCHRNKNELLYAAYREVLIDIGDFSDLSHISFAKTLIQTIVLTVRSPLYVVGFFLDSLAALLLFLPKYLVSTNDAEKYSNYRFDRRKEFIRDYLAKLKEILPTMGDRMQKQMIEWIDNEHEKFQNKVKGYFKIVCRTTKDRHRAHELARSFAPRFARIECHLAANLNLATHHGSRPVINQQVLSTGGFFTVHPASWDGENELVAKKLRDHITNQDFVYMEAHFHRAVTNLNIPHMVHLKYLYKENDSSLYLLLPRYDIDLHSFLKDNMKKITADMAIKISRDIAGVIAHMHAHDLVHRDIKVQNILIDKQEQVYLADFGTCQHGIENGTVVGSHPLPPDLTTLPLYKGTAVDVYLLGMLMYVCAPKDTYVPPSDNVSEQIHLLDRRKVPESYCQLITRCLNKDFRKRPTAKQIVDELEAMAKPLCITCADAPRSLRFEPCGHKLVCTGCLDRIPRKNGQLQCITCNQVVTSTREDDDANTFIATS